MRLSPQGNTMDLRCVIAAISVLLPACGAKSLNSPIISNYSTSANISNSSVVPIPLLHPLTRPPAPRSSSKGNRENTLQDTNPPPSASSYSLHDRDNGVAIDDEIGLNRSSGDDQQRTLSDSSCLVGLSCEEFFSLTPPRDVFDLVPPPPFPLFLFELEVWPKRETGFSNWGLQVKKFNFRSYYLFQREDNEGEGAIVVRINPEWLSASDLQECSFCNWARNESMQPLFTFMQAPQVKVTGLEYWHETVLGVAFISATFGACLTCAFLKLRHVNRKKTTHEEVKVGPGNYTNGGQGETIREKGTPHAGPLKTKQKDLDQEWTDKKETASILRRSPPSPELKEDFSEELYINANAPSDTDSELTLDKNPKVSGDSTKFPSVSTISSDVSSSTFQICDPLCRLSMKEAFHKRRRPVIENFAFNSSRCDQSSFPLKAPLSPLSYSSDEPVCEILPNRKKRKKRKGDINTVKGHLGDNLKEVPETLNVQSLVIGEPIPNLERPLQDRRKSWCIDTYHSKNPGGAQVRPPSTTQYMTSLKLLKAPATVSVNKVPHFPCSPPIPYFDNLAFNLVKTNECLHSRETLFPFKRDLNIHLSDSVKGTFNPYIVDNDERNIYRIDQDILRKVRFVFPHLYHLKTDNPCRLDYEIYKEYSSSEVPTEYI